jgi:4-amino-4-deoxy-L-arabinose transferase-like glycosyltransferase
VTAPNPSHPTSATVGPPNRARTAMIAALISFIAGQGLLVALTPFSRAADPMGGRVGVALLGGDSAYYLSASVDLATIATEPWPRTGFLLVLWVGHRLGEPIGWLLCLHVIVSVAAGALLYDLGRRAAGTAGGWLSAAVLLVNPMVAQWFRFVQTETLFYGLIVALLWMMTRVATDGLTSRRVTALVLMAAVGATLRPNGLVLAGTVATFLGVVRLRRSRRLLVIVAVWSTILVALAAGLGATERDPDRTPAGLTYRGEVVMGAPWAEVLLPMPPPDDPEDRSLSALARYAADHPLAVLKLPVARVALEVAQVRRHYPPPVNVAVATAMAALLGAIAVGLRGPRRLPVLPAVLLSVPQAALVAVTWAIPEGRFGWAFLLPFAPTAAAGTVRILRSVRAVGRGISRPAPAGTP